MTTIDNRGVTGGYPSIATGADGIPVLAFYQEDLAILQVFLIFYITKI